MMTMMEEEGSEFKIFIAKLKLPILGGILLSISSSLILLDFSKVLGCSQSLKNFHNSYKFIKFHLIKFFNRHRHHHHQEPQLQEPRTHLLYDLNSLSVAIGLFLIGSLFKLFLNFIDLNLNDHHHHSKDDNSIFDPSILSNHSNPQNLLKKALFFLLAGLLSGSGTTLASGCTSGHMLCGMARGSKRSIVATCTFFPTAIITHRILMPLLAKIGTPSESDSFYQEFSNLVPVTTLDRILCASLFMWPCIVYVALKLFLPNRLIFLRFGLLGATFGSGLALSGMTKPSTVLGFFNFPLPTWDPSLLGVAIAGLGLNTFFYWAYIRPRINSWLSVRQLVSNGTTSEVERPLLDKLDCLAPAEANPSIWQLPEMTNNEITTRLILGCILFGLGWGLSGICPGPALVVFGAYPLSLTMWSWHIGFFAGSKAVS